MRMGRVCLAALVVSALAGCMPSGSVRPLDASLLRVSCPGDVCEPIEVVMMETGTAANPKCEIRSVSIPGASLVGLPTGDKTMQWVLKDPENLYEFSKDEWKFGIFFKDDGADPTGKFKQVNVSNNKLTIKFAKGVPADATGYSYGLTVRRSSNKRFCTSLDPWLVG